MPEERLDLGTSACGKFLRVWKAAQGQTSEHWKKSEGTQKEMETGFPCQLVLLIGQPSPG